MQDSRKLNQPGAPVLKTEHLTRVAGENTVVNDICVQIEEGQVTAIVGPSGAGKSSFLRLLNRLDEPTSGTVYVHGQDYRTIPPRQLRRQIGMVMQRPYLFPGTVANNLRFGPSERGEELPQPRLEYLLDQVGLAGYADREVTYLSGGEAQRVSLARTLANTPEVLLLDEPTSALDEAAERDVEVLLNRIFEKENLTCLIVTHDMKQAERLATHAILLKGGRLIQAGPIGEVLHARSTL